MNSRNRTYLERFGDRVRFERIERRLYGHDIAAIPNLIKPLIGDTTPDAVVQPQNARELVNLTRCAKDDAQGDASDAAAGEGSRPDARVHGRADAGSDAQSHGQPVATHDWRCSATCCSAND